MAKAIKMVTKNVPLEKIPFNHDPLTLILKDALAGKLKINLESLSKKVFKGQCGCVDDRVVPSDITDPR